MCSSDLAGTDILEIGIPFSDPIADGPVIQQASYEAIMNGVTTNKIFQAVEELRAEDVKIPIVFMLYYNTVVSFGIDAFAKKCQEVGVDGLIIPDLPFEEQEDMQKALEGDDRTILLQLVSPVSKNRISTILENARGFVYCVSSMGVTGQKGFGIRSAKDVAPMKDVIDGAIVGTHFINLLRENDYQEDVAAKYCSTFKQELNEL